MRTLDVSSKVVSVGTIQRYINLAKDNLQTPKDFELSCVKRKGGTYDCISCIPRL